MDFQQGAKQVCSAVHAVFEEVANYIQCTLANVGYLVSETIRTGQEQSIPLPPPVDPNDPDKMDLEAIWVEDVKTMAKRQ